ncbi:MAG: ribonuclease R [Verrucomicrobiales bacterium]|nr:ribonuclease R [Verrucomicrobiales bacterium]
MKEQLLELLGAKGYFPADAAELARRMGLSPGRVGELRRLLEGLEQSGAVARIKGHRYILPDEADLIPGRIRMNRQGKGWLAPDQAGLSEIEIPESATGTAMHEDRVLVRRDWRAKEGKPGEVTAQTGVVVRVLERRRTQFVGTLRQSRHFWYVIPDDPRIPHDIYVPEPRDVGGRVRVGDKVVVDLKEWLSRHTNPEGEIVEVLGAPDAEGVDLLSVLRQYGLPLRFPREVLEEARSRGSEVTAADRAGRVDCRGHTVVTIDPDDAKDFDDAISLERGSKGGWRLWVHIADVSHYVRPGTALDREARKRGNSTYLVDRVIPMLPEALSNELCSLKPDVERLTKCVEFRVSDAGRVVETKFYPAVIRSKRRFTYQEALAVLKSKPAGPIEAMLHDAHRLAQTLRRERFRAGSLDLDFPEMKIRLDEHGKVRRIERMENDVSHQLIEEFMLLANEAVAARLMAMRRPAVYRVHEAPAERRLREYREEVSSHGIPCGPLGNRAEVQRLLHRLGGMAIGPALKIGFLKSLMRARYAVEPLGHYGLAKAKYTHFTSPIRRYADLVVHRALFEKPSGPPSGSKEIADHLSDTERNSADAERDSKDVKMFAYLTAQLTSGKPETYAALVTDVRNFGFFVDVPDLAMSGLVPLSSIEDDFYVFDPARRQLVGRRTRRVIRLGDRPSVRVAKVDPFKKQVDFGLVSARSSAVHRGVSERRPSDRRPRPFESGARPPASGARRSVGARERAWPQNRPVGGAPRTTNPPGRAPMERRPERKPEGNARPRTAEAGGRDARRRGGRGPVTGSSRRGGGNAS